MHIHSQRVVVEKVEEEKKEGFQTVQVQDSSTFKGKVVALPEQTIYVDNHVLEIGDILLFAQNSPDTHLIPDFQGKEVKFVLVADILAVL